MALEKELLDAMTAAIATAVGDAVKAVKTELTDFAQKAGAAGVDEVKALVTAVDGKVAALEANPAGAKPAEAKPVAGVTLDQVRTLLAEQQTAAQATQTAAAASAAVKAKVAAFAADKLKDLPEIYRAQLPETDDAAKLAAAEQTIRTQFRADLTAAGIKLADLGTAAGADKGVGSAKPDVSKMSPTAALAFAYQQETAGAAAK